MREKVIMNDLKNIVNIAARSEAATKVYGKEDTLVRALDGVDVSFESGKFSAIMGPSGSGKSTLMHCMAGLDNLSSGKVFIGNTDLTELSEKELTLLRRSNIGFIFQSFNLVPTLNALENITLPIDLSGNKIDKDWVDQITEVVNLSDRLKHKPNELSGGQQQRVAVSRALASKPNIIFADEPTGNLDSKTGNEILDFMRLATTDLNQTIVMVTHDPVAASYSDRVIFLEDGKVVGEIIEPTADSVIDHMRTFGSSISHGFISTCSQKCLFKTGPFSSYFFSRFSRRGVNNCSLCFHR